MGRSVLDDLGQEITGIAAPVSICMFVTVALVRLLNPEGASNAGAVYWANVYYNEDESDSAGTKLSGAVINALVFVAVITLSTFIMVMLFKYRCTKFLYAYLGLSGFSIFFLLTGIIVIQLLQKAGAHMDWISFSYILFNFATVGAVCLFFTPAPLLLKQTYLIVIGVVVAFVFTWIPEWTTWVLLVAMALYDIAAVLAPGGPLKMLVELAQEREEDIPALVYEARRVERRPAAEQQQRTAPADIERESPGSSNGSGGAPTTPLIPPEQHPSEDLEVIEVEHEHRPAAAAVGAGTPLSPHAAAEAAAHPSEATAFALPEAIKLGLGDFIFYSVLLGRAAMADAFTVAVCYVAVIAGLGATLLWLAVTHHALPALPISIALAVAFYFASRFVMEPVLLPAVLRLTFF